MLTATPSGRRAKLDEGTWGVNAKLVELGIKGLVRGFGQGTETIAHDTQLTERAR